MGHELLWTRDPYFEGSRAYCRCGWVVSGGLNAGAQRDRFVAHLEELWLGVIVKEKDSK